jgi:large subunit ribosomal protein L24
MKVKKGDSVVVLSGDDKGKTGKVLNVDPAKQRIIVEGVNFIKRHTRPTQKNPKGGVIEKEAFVYASKVAVFCNKCSSITRVGYRIVKSETTNSLNKVRICSKCGEIL